TPTFFHAANDSAITTSGSGVPSQRCRSYPGFSDQRIVCSGMPSTSRKKPTGSRWYCTSGRGRPADVKRVATRSIAATNGSSSIGSTRAASTQDLLPVLEELREHLVSLRRRKRAHEPPLHRAGELEDHRLKLLFLEPP